MPKIAQGDVFCYLNRRGKNAYHTEEEIAEAVNRVFHTSLDKSAVNGIKRGKNRGAAISMIWGRSTSFIRRYSRRSRAATS